MREEWSSFVVAWVLVDERIYEILPSSEYLTVRFVGYPLARHLAGLLKYKLSCFKLSLSISGEKRQEVISYFHFCSIRQLSVGSHF